LPGRPDGLAQQPQATSYHGRGYRPASEGPYVIVLGVARHFAKWTFGGERLQQPLLGELLGLPVVDPCQARSVEGDEPCKVPERGVQRGYVRVADEDLGVGPDSVEVQVFDGLGRAVAALEAVDHVHLVVGEHGHQVLRPALGGACHVGVARKDVAAKLDLVALFFPPLHTAQNLAAVVVGARRGGTPMVPPGRRTRPLMVNDGSFSGGSAGFGPRSRRRLSPALRPRTGLCPWRRSPCWRRPRRQIQRTTTTTA
jgi:hypothetical protein